VSPSVDIGLDVDGRTTDALSHRLKAASAAITVAIADDHALFRAGLRKLLDALGLAVVGEAANGVEAVQIVRRLEPDVLLLDLAMDTMNGMDVLQFLVRETTSTRIVVLTAAISSSQVTEALATGAVGVVMKTEAVDVLDECVRAVAGGKYWVGREHAACLAEAVVSLRRGGGRRYGLTPRELDVVHLISEGCSNPEIAERLRIAGDTVKHHLSRVFDKTGTSTRVELALFAHHHCLSSPERF